MILLAFFLSLIQVVCSIPSPDGLRTAVIGWEIPAVPDGKPLLLNGTAEQVHEQLRQINPRWDQDFKFQRRDLGDDSHDSLVHMLNMGIRPRALGEYSACGSFSCTARAGLWLCGNEVKPAPKKEEWDGLLESIREGKVDKNRWTICTTTAQNHQPGFNIPNVGTGYGNRKRGLFHWKNCTIFIIQDPDCGHLMDHNNG